LIVLTLVVAPGIGNSVVRTDPVCPVRPDSGNCVACAPCAGVEVAPAAGV